MGYEKGLKIVLGMVLIVLFAACGNQKEEDKLNTIKRMESLK